MPFNDLKKLLKLSRAFKDKYSNLSVAFFIVFISVTFFFFSSSGVIHTQCRKILAWILVIVSEGKGEIDLCHFIKRQEGVINSQL